MTDLPPGWFGKPHAMHTGAGAARGEWLLFVDADCRQAPHSARAAVNFLASRGGDMLSLWPVLEMHGFWENAVQPVAGSVLVAWFRPGWVNDPRRRDGLCQWSIYPDTTVNLRGRRRVRAIRDQIVEDIALARRVKGLGHRLWNAVGTDLFTTRMYDSLSRPCTRAGRGSTPGPSTAPAWLAAVILLTALFTLAPMAALAAAAVALAGGAVEPAWAALFVLNLAAVVLTFLTMRRYMIAGRSNPWYLFYYPVSVVLVLGFQAGAMLRVLGLRSTTWRGTTYRGREGRSERNGE